MGYRGRGSSFRTRNRARPPVEPAITRRADDWGRTSLAGGLAEASCQQRTVPGSFMVKPAAGTWKMSSRNHRLTGFLVDRWWPPREGPKVIFPSSRRFASQVGRGANAQVWLLPTPWGAMNLIAFWVMRMRRPLAQRGFAWEGVGQLPTQRRIPRSATPVKRPPRRVKASAKADDLPKGRPSLGALGPAGSLNRRPPVRPERAPRCAPGRNAARTFAAMRSMVL